MSSSSVQGKPGRGCGLEPQCMMGKKMGMGTGGTPGMVREGIPNHLTEAQENCLKGVAEP